MDRITPQVIEAEMKQSYLDYAMSVIVGRALPDVRDGLKPVHRRILFAMRELGMFHNKPHKKCARIVGEVLGKYHPHGDSAVYDALVRMAQDFSLRYPLIDGHGNFGSIDGDSAAAMRYCVTGDTLVQTDAGILPIRDISSKKEARINMKICSYDGKKNLASKFFNSGRRKIIEVKTKLGYGVRGSLNHPILCWSFRAGLPQVEWKLLKNVNAGDVALLNRAHSLFSKKSTDLMKYHLKKGFKNNLCLPSRMNDSLAFLLGALVSEGSFHNKQILFSNKDVQFYNDVKSVIKSQFKGVRLCERCVKGGCTELRIYEQKVVLFLENIGLKKSKSDKKEIPFSVLRSTKKNVRSFLCGLFEGGGSVSFKTDKRHKGKSIELTYNSKSAMLINQLKVLLLNFGIVTTKPYQDKRNGCFKLIISGYDSIRNFKENVGFFSRRKKAILAKVKAMNSSRGSKTDFIPFINEYLRKKYKKPFVLRHNFNGYNSLEKNYSTLVKFIDSKDKRLIDFILKKRYLFDKISTIKKSNRMEEVFSLKVDSKCHSFIANGFINHNTEARLKSLAEELLDDLDKETVAFRDNFDASLKEPVVLPAKAPNLLINGSSGIAVGMATNIPPHNLKEVTNATIHLIDNPEACFDDLLSFIPAPDFPTGGEIVGVSGIKQAYATGQGRAVVRAVVDEEKDCLVIREIPYMVNKSQLIIQIADLVKDKRIEGIRNIRDESDREGIRVVIELKSNSDSSLVLKQLFSFSRLQVSVSIMLLALVDNQPKLMPLKMLLKHFIDHRRVVVRKRIQFDLNKAVERAHILEGIIIALDDVDKVIQGIRRSRDVGVAKVFLIEQFQLTDVQAKAILEMRLQKLASLEVTKTKDEFKQLKLVIDQLRSILSSEKKVLEIIKSELNEVSDRYGDNRRTKIIEGDDSVFNIESLMEEQDVVITLSRQGYVKRFPLSMYREQHRGGKGAVAAGKKEEDVLVDLFVTSTHSTLLCFTDSGGVHWIKAYQVPEAGRHAKGKPIVNLLNLKGQSVSKIIPVKIFDTRFVMMVTKKGKIKKTSLNQFSKPRRGGIRAIALDDDELIEVRLAGGDDEVVIATKFGQAIHFSESTVRPMGRTAAGVRGISLTKNDEVIGMQIVSFDATILTITDKGYGKRSNVSDYRLTGRGGKGVANIKLSDKNGFVVSMKSVKAIDSVLCMTRNGVAIRIPVSDIPVIGRATQGVRVMRIGEGDKVVAVELVSNGSASSN